MQQDSLQPSGLRDGITPRIYRARAMRKVGCGTWFVGIRTQGTDEPSRHRQFAPTCPSKTKTTYSGPNRTSKGRILGRPSSHLYHHHHHHHPLPLPASLCLPLSSPENATARTAQAPTGASNGSRVCRELRYRTERPACQNLESAGVQACRSAGMQRSISMYRVHLGRGG